MQIQRVKLKNLASLEGEINLDFNSEPLKSAGIFAITGQTGSGKSTILDAICLALYGTTPRYNSNSERGPKFLDVSGNYLSLSDARRILRIGASEGCASVEFLGITGDLYRAEWFIRRARNKADGNLMAAEISLDNLTRNTKEQGTASAISNRIQEVAGLTFGQFTRVILLSQGEFAAFLKAGSGDRAELLEKLTGTEIYSVISQKVFEKHRAEDSILQNLNFQKNAVALLSPEEKEEKEIQLISIEGEKATEINRQEEHIAHLSWLAKLAELQTNIDKEDGKLRAASAMLAENADKKELLNSLEKIGPVRPQLTEKVRLETELGQTQARITEANQTLDLLTNNLNQARESKIKLKAELEKAESAKSNAEPEISKAIELDAQIRGIRETLQKANEKLDSIHKDLEKKQREEKDCKIKLANLKDHQSELEAYFAVNESRKALAENTPFVVSKLVDAQSFLQQEMDARDLEAAAQMRLETAKKLKEEKKDGFDHAKEELSGLISEISEQKNRLNELNPATILDDLNQMQEIISILGNDISVLEKIDIQEANLGQDREVLTQKESQLKKLGDDFHQMMPELEIAQANMEESQNVLRISRLAVAESVVDLRHQLADNEDCPVCGSKEHPYRVGKSDLGSMNEFLEKEAARYQQQFNQLSGNKTAFENQISGLVAEIPNLKDKMAHAEEGIREQYSLLSDKTLVLKDLKICLDKEKERQYSLNELQKAVNALQNSINEKVGLEAKTNEKCNSLKVKITRLDGVLNTETNSIKLHKSAVEAALTSYRQTMDELFPFFDKENWEANWRQNPESFVKALKEFSNEWVEKYHLQQENLQQILRIEGDVKTAGDAFKSLTNQFLENQRVLESDKQHEQSFVSDRNSVLNGRPVTEVQEELKNAVETAKVGLDVATQSLKEFELAEEGFRSDIRNYKENLDKFRKELESADRSIQLWLERNPEFSFEGILELMSIPEEEIRQTRMLLEEINDQIKNAESVLKVYRLNLDQHQLAQKNSLAADETESILQELKIRIETLDKQCIQIKSELENHANQKKLAGRLLDEIRKQEEIFGGWAQLNQIIGSSDGKKFRQKAQEYTLDVLLAYANVQMQILNKRYKLERIPESLSLQIVDLDMGGEVRPVGTLSGGESFLASLALALGLSSLTSASMRVDSLFIDEGFGSLDPQTLSIAMDALERLNNQGKKVGVISHVQEMTERIPVQIRVYKENNGKSRVEVTH